MLFLKQTLINGTRKISFDRSITSKYSEDIAKIYSVILGLMKYFVEFNVQCSCTYIVLIK